MDLAEVLAELRVPAWQRDAACAEHPGRADAWFPAAGQSARFAKSVCAGCLVRAECLAYAVAGDLPGIWGGTSPQERRQVARAPV